MIARRPGEAVARRKDDLAPLAIAMREGRESGEETQEQLAVRGGLDRGFVGAVERAERNLGHRKLRQLLIAIGWSWYQWGKLMQELDPLPNLSKNDRVERNRKYAEQVQRLVAEGQTQDSARDILNNGGHAARIR
jgi:transcriptional regulator with XRE-family HTH domain